MAKQNTTSRPYIPQRIVLHSYDAQQAYQRTFDYTSNSLYLLGIILPIIGDEDQADEYIETFQASIQRCADDLKQEIGRMRKLIDENGLNSEDVSYTHTLTEEAKISSPMDNLYLGLIQDLDELFRMMSVLWISGVFNQRQYRQGVMNWRRRVMKLGTGLGRTVRRAMIAARKDGKEADVKSAMKAQGVDEETLASVEQGGEDEDSNPGDGHDEGQKPAAEVA